MHSLVRIRHVVAAALFAWAGVGAFSALAQTVLATAPNLAPGFRGLGAGDKVLLMPIDVELFTLGAVGGPEPRADWTAQALTYLNQAVRSRQAQARVAVVELSAQQVDDAAELVALHAAVARAIALHHFDKAPALTTKGGRLDWSLGGAMQWLQAASGARYALFIWIRDTYGTAELVAGRYFLGLLLAFNPVGTRLGWQVGYASLVDMEDGQVVWFNRILRGGGDLREPGPAREAIDALLSGFPGEP